MDKPLISIIIPVYNSDKTINRCVDSILSQTFNNWELLLIDDGSTDRSGELCDEYSAKDQRIKVFHKKNGGVSSARNLGLNNVKGEWITFCDSDDFVYPNWLKNYVDNISDGIDLICQAFECDKPLVHEFKDKRIFGITYKGCIQDGILLLYKNDILGYLWVKLFKRSIIESYKLRFDTRYNYQEDQEFCFKYFCYIKTIVCIENVGYYYYIPDWNLKYLQKNNMFYLYQSLYKSAMIIYYKNFNNLIAYFLECWIQIIFNIYNDRDPFRRKSLLTFRKSVGKNIMKSHLFFLTKLFVYLDRTAYLSDIVLKLHIKLKNRV